MMESLIGVAVLLGLVMIPVAVYSFVSYRHAREWQWTEKVPLQTGAAYRGSWLSVAHDPGAPKMVKVASFVSLAFLVPAVVSLPAMALGLCEDSDHGVGPATLLGPAGFALAVATFVAGIKLLRRRPSAPRFALGIGIWTILHNVGVIWVVVTACTMQDSLNESWRAFGIDGLGMVAIPYALVSFAHAGLLIAASQAHREAPADEPAIAEETPSEYAHA